MQIFYFSGATFSQFWDIVEKFISRSPVSFLEAVFAWTTYNDPNLPKIPIKITHRCFGGKMFGSRKGFFLNLKKFDFLFLRHTLYVT